MAPSKRILGPYFETGSDKFKMAAAKTGRTCISAYIQDSKEIPTAICMFLGSENLMALSERLFFETRSQKFKMVAVKLEVPLSQLLHKIVKKFQLLSAYLWDRRHLELSERLHIETGSQIFKMAAAQPEVPLSRLL
jgi:hypothetical protein